MVGHPRGVSGMGTNGIVECKFLSKTRTMPVIMHEELVVVHGLVARGRWRIEKEEHHASHHA